MPKQILIICAVAVVGTGSSWGQGSRRVVRSPKASAKAKAASSGVQAGTDTQSRLRLYKMGLSAAQDEISQENRRWAKIAPALQAKYRRQGAVLTAALKKAPRAAAYRRAFAAVRPPSRVTRDSTRQYFSALKKASASFEGSFAGAQRGAGVAPRAFGRDLSRLIDPTGRLQLVHRGLLSYSYDIPVPRRTVNEEYDVALGTPFESSFIVPRVRGLVNHATADPATGSLFASFTSLLTQNEDGPSGSTYAAVGSTFTVRSGYRKLRVSATLRVDNIETTVVSANDEFAPHNASIRAILRVHGVNAGTRTLRLSVHHVTLVGMGTKSETAQASLIPLELTYDLPGAQVALPYAVQVGIEAFATRSENVQTFSTATGQVTQIQVDVSR